jgi:hypothetical protein
MRVGGVLEAQVERVGRGAARARGAERGAKEDLAGVLLVG